jgi:hypothetical protein
MWGASKLYDMIMQRDGVQNGSATFTAPVLAAQQRLQWSLSFSDD